MYQHHDCGRNGAACGTGCHPAIRNVPYHASMKEDEYERGARTLASAAGLVGKAAMGVICAAAML